MFDVKTSAVERIEQFNQGRQPEMLKLKYQAMRASAFGFYRGTCHLFYEDWHQAVSAESPLNQAPAAWICGDLHLENFGSYKGDNGLVYFDMNDFDEAVLAPCTWDVARFLTSILVGIHALQIREREAGKLCQMFLQSYTAALVKGHTRSFERATATGLIKELLTTLKHRPHKAFLDAHTEGHHGNRRLRVDGKHFLAVTKTERTRVTHAIKTWTKAQPDSDFYKVLDVAHRVAGTGSLGVDRYALLVEGHGSPDDNALLDLKEAPASSLQPYVTLPQPPWEDDAERVVAIQARVQAIPQARLTHLDVDGKPYVLHQLQPVADRVNLAGNGRLKQVDSLITSMAQIVAWGQLRASGRQGSATADAFIAFGQTTGWHQPLLDYVHTYRHQVQADYESFCQALDQGGLKT